MTISKPRVKGPAAPGSYVAQQLGAKDCAIATVATVTGLSYKEVADAFGIPVDQKGMPDANAIGPGIKWGDTVIPLYRLGWVATPWLTSEHPGNTERADWPSSDEIKSLIDGRKAVVSYIDEDIDAHSLAWTGKEAIDCSNGTIVDLDSLTLTEALLVGRALSC